MNTQPNRQVSKEYVKLKHSIRSCTNMEQLDGLHCLVQQHCGRFNHENDLIQHFIIKQGELTPDLSIDEIESLIHQRRCGAH